MTVENHMSTPKHSPLPWRIQGGNCGTLSGVMSPAGPVLMLGRLEMLNPADVSLVLAAPKLLEAVKRLLKFNEELCQDVNVSTNYPSADFARAAIAEAEAEFISFGTT